MTRGQGDRLRTRRDLLLLLAAAASAPWSALSQAKQVLIAYLSASSRHGQGDVLGALRESLAALGWKEGVNLVLEDRWADGRYEQLQALGEELTAKKPAIIVASSSRAVAVAAKAAPTTPIVVAGGDPG